MVVSRLAPKPYIIVLLATCLTVCLAACWADIEPGSTAPASEAAVETFTAPPPVVRRLTVEQYQRVIGDLFGGDVLVPAALEPDFESAGFISIGQALSTISPRGMEQYESAAHAIAEQALASRRVRSSLVPCEPTGTIDDVCARQALSPLALRAWRRPPAEEELERLVGVAAVGASALDDFDAGLSYAIAAVLLSPNFLFRAELGEADPDVVGAFRYTDYEMASRLSFFIWDTGPDDELLAAAERGELTGEAGLTAQAERLIRSPRARDGVRRYFTEMLELHRLDDLSKDTNLFIHMSPQVGAAAREETLMGIEHLVFERARPSIPELWHSECPIERGRRVAAEDLAPQADSRAESVGPTALWVVAGRAGETRTRGDMHRHLTVAATRQLRV